MKTFYEFEFKQGQVTTCPGEPGGITNLGGLIAPAPSPVTVLRIEARALEQMLAEYTKSLDT